MPNTPVSIVDEAIKDIPSAAVPKEGAPRDDSKKKTQKVQPTSGADEVMNAMPGSAVSKKGKPRSSKKKLRKVQHGLLHIKASFNNTIITITDQQGNTLGWKSAGGEGAKGSRKATLFSAQVAAQKLGEYIKNEYKMEFIDVYIKGPGAGREAYKVLLFFKIMKIDDITGIPHNGPRSRKKRRV